MTKQINLTFSKKAVNATVTTNSKCQNIKAWNVVIKKGKPRYSWKESILSWVNNQKLSDFIYEATFPLINQGPPMG